MKVTRPVKLESGGELHIIDILEGLWNIRYKLIVRSIDKEGNIMDEIVLEERTYTPIDLFKNLMSNIKAFIFPVEVVIKSPEIKSFCSGYLKEESGWFSNKHERVYEKYASLCSVVMSWQGLSERIRG